MLNLREQLQQCFRGRVCLLGLGKADYGDDAFGVHLAEALAPRANVVLAGTAPERFVAQAAAGAFDHVIFLDAVHFGGAPGEVVFLDADGMAARFPQVSTHKLALGLLARRVEADGRTRAWLLGVQPGSLRPAEAGARAGVDVHGDVRPALTPAVRTTFELLRQLLSGMSAAGDEEPAETSEVTA